MSARNGPAAFAMMKAASHPSSDTISNTKPRHSPTSTDSPNTASSAMSTQPSWRSKCGRSGSQREHAAAGSPSALIFDAVLSASALVAYGPTRTRTRLPPGVSTCWVYVFRPIFSTLARTSRILASSVNAPTCTTKRPPATAVSDGVEAGATTGGATTTGALTCSAGVAFEAATTGGLAVDAAANLSGLLAAGFTCATVELGDTEATGAGTSLARAALGVNAAASDANAERRTDGVDAASAAGTEAAGRAS